MTTTKSKNKSKSVENTDNNNSGKILDHKEIAYTPFDAVTIDSEHGKTNFIAWGKNRVSNFMDDTELEEKVQELEAGKISWEIVGAMAACIAINIIEENKTK